MTKYFKENYNIDSVKVWFNKSRGIPKKYQHRVEFCGIYEDYKKLKWNKNYKEEISFYKSGV